MESAKLFRKGKRQAIRLPKAYRLRGTMVYLKRMGNAIVVIPEYDSWQALLASLPLFSADFMAARVQPPAQTRAAW